MSTREKQIAFFTIGETPRSDIVPEMQRFLGDHVQIHEFGVLDGLTTEELATLAPVQGQHRFATRRRDGSLAELGKEATEARLAALMRQADNSGDYDLLVPLCTGTAIPRLETLVVEPQQVVDQLTAALSRHARSIGAVVPLTSQLDTFHLDADIACDVLLAHASPYAEDRAETERELRNAGRQLAGADFIVMHCMGYRAWMRQIVAQAAQRPVLLSNQLVAQTLAQLLEPSAPA